MEDSLGPPTRALNTGRSALATAVEVDADLAMPLATAMLTQRAVRRLRSDPVDDEVVLRCLELAMHAPTGRNRRAWEFVVVRDPAVKHQLARLNRQAWSVYRRVAGRHTPQDPATRRLVAAVQWQADHFEEIPVVVVACLHGRSPVLAPPALAASYYGSIFPAVQNLLLAAQAAGLGAALVTLPLWSVNLARRTLGLPGSVTPVAAVPLGWPDRNYGPTSRQPVEEVVHLDRYGHQPFLGTPRTGAPAAAE
jgi:nitroreductase